MHVRRYFNRALRLRIIAGDVPGWLERHSRRNYLIAKYKSVLPWVDAQAIISIHEHAYAMTKKTGRKHVVDHIVPLNHPRVCGLTVPWNLRVVPDEVNSLKSNAWCDWHGDLFEEPEQFSLWR